MQMAWDEKKWNLETLPDYLREFAGGQFGPGHAREIAGILEEYYRLGYQRKPEHLQWYIGREKPRPSDFTYTDYGNEGKVRLEAYGSMARRVRELEGAMPAAKKDAFFELVEYPVLGAAAANRRLLAGEMAALGLRQGRANVRDWTRLFDSGTADLTAGATRFNDACGGKVEECHGGRSVIESRSYRNAILSLPPAATNSRLLPRRASGWLSRAGRRL